MGKPFSLLIKNLQSHRFDRNLAVKFLYIDYSCFLGDEAIAAREAIAETEVVRGVVIEAEVGTANGAEIETEVGTGIEAETGIGIAEEENGTGAETDGEIGAEIATETEAGKETGVERGEEVEIEMEVATTVGSVVMGKVVIGARREIEVRNEAEI